MKRTTLIFILSALLTACSSGRGDGKKSSSGGGPSGSGNPAGPQGEGGTEYSCLIVDPLSKKTFAGFGDSPTSATELGQELCRHFIPAGGSCQASKCEVRLAERTWKCAVVNSNDGYVTEARGRTSVEAFSEAHGLCAAGINASAASCTVYEQANCVIEQAANEPAADPTVTPEPTVGGGSELSEGPTNEAPSNEAAPETSTEELSL